MPRILVASVIGLIGFLVYLGIAVTLGGMATQLNWLLQAIYFLIAGTIWVLPVRSLMYWQHGGSK